MTKERYLDVQMAASHLNLKESRIRYEVQCGRIPHYKIGRNLRFKESDLNTWFDSMKKIARAGKAANG